MQQRWTMNATGALILLCAGAARAATGIYTEAVSDYSGTSNDLPGAIPNCDGFRSRILQSSSWTASDRWTDGDVWDSDFVDSSRSAAGRDHDWFDRTGNASAISYFCGHGTAINGIPAQFGLPFQFCFSPSPSSQCNTPPQSHGFSGPGFCRFQPPPTQPNGRGVCTYNYPRFIIVNGASSSFDNSVNYSFTSSFHGLQYVRFGESSQSGVWGNAATNGGTNLVVLDLSNGVLPGFYSQHLLQAFAGVHVIATLMPITGDTAMVSGRGTKFADRAIVNPSGSVATAWKDALSNLSSSDGTTCGFKPGDGGRGFNGCGCNVAMAAGATSTEATDHLNETWTQIRSDSRDGKGAAFWRATWRCNYDVAAYPFDRG
jgi:hypothetical protein